MYTASSHTYIVCAYGESPYLAECITSLQAQTVASTIAVATSTPNSLIAKVAQNAGVPVYESGKAPGIASDWDHALSRASTPLVTIAHQDDTYCPTYTEHMLSGMNRVSDPLIFFSNYGELRNGVEVNDSKLLNTKRILLKPITKHDGVSNNAKTKRRILSLGNAICCPSITFNMERVPQGLFSSSVLKSNLDWEAWERLARTDGAFIYDQEVLMHHRIHEGSETSALIRDNTRTAEDLAMLKKFWPAPVATLINRVYAMGQKSNSN